MENPIKPQINKKTLERLKELRKNVISLPEYYYSEEEFTISSNSKSEAEKEAIEQNLSKRVDEKQKVYRQIYVFLNANLEKENPYSDSLSEITFRPKEGIWNTYHYRNNEEWKIDRNKLINLLDLLEIELEEKLRITNNKSENTRHFLEKDMFSSSLFWTLIILVGGVCFTLGIYKSEHEKSSVEFQNTILQNELDELKLKNEKILKGIKKPEVNSDTILN